MATKRNSIWYISRCKEAGNFNIFYIGEKLTIKHENKELKKKKIQCQEISENRKVVSPKPKSL